MNLRIILAVIFIFIFIHVSGFSKTVYIDKPTPAGSVAPVQTIQNANSLNSKTQSPADVYRDLNPESMAPSPQLDVGGQEVDMVIIDDFSIAYEKTGSPKMTIFFNRFLSDEIREWSSNSRFISSGNGSFKLADSNSSVMEDNGLVNHASYPDDGENKTMDMEVMDGSIIITSQVKKGLEGDRSSIVEENMWRIENGFIKGFREAHANIVDRPTILRLMAMKYDSNDTVDLPEKNIKMSALSYYSDVYIEMMIKRIGHEYYFKTIAKEVKTGRILAIAGSDDVHNRAQKEIASIDYIATGSGVQKAVLEEKTIEDIAFDLSLCLMEYLTKTWSHN